MKKTKWIFGLSSLFLLSTSWASSPVFSITPSLTQTTLRSDSETSAFYTVHNNASVAIHNLQVNPGYNKNGSHSVTGLTLQNDGCSGATLSANASCGFGVAISGANRPNHFVITPSVSGNNGHVSSTTSSNNALTVNVDQVTNTPYAYFGTRLAPGLLGIPTTSKLVPVSTISPYTLGTAVTNLNLAASASSKTSIAVSLDGSYVYAAEQPNNHNPDSAADILVLTGGPSPIIIKRIVLPGIVTALGLPTSPPEFTFFIAVTPDGNGLYVTATDSNSTNAAFFINLTTDVVTPLSATFAEPSSVAVSPDGLRAYILNKTGGNDVSGSIMVFDTSTNELITTIDNDSLGFSAFHLPAQVAINSSNSILYASNTDTSNVVSLTIGSGDSYQFADNISLSDTPAGLTVSADGNYLYVTSAESEHVYQVNTSSSTVVDLSTSNTGAGVALTPDNTSLFTSLNNHANPEVFTGLPTDPSSSTAISLDSPDSPLPNYGAFIN